MATIRAGAFTPEGAVAAFKSRRKLLPSFRWQDVWQEEHSTGLAVAGVSRLDVLQVFQDALDQVVQDGGHLADFYKAVQPQLAAKGFWGDVEVTDPATGETRITRFDNRRLRLIFDTNLRQSHAVGRWQRAQATKDDLPYLVYVTMHDDRVRPAHAAWDYLALPVDHPFWNTHLPPNGWLCRCHYFQTDEAGLEALRKAGKKVRTEPPPADWMTYVNPRTGEAVPVPRGIDPGFAYNPGKARDAAFFDEMLRKATTAQPLASAVAVAQATAQRPAFTAQAAEQFGAWVRQVVAAGQPRGDLRFVGVLRAPLLRALQQAELSPRSAAIAMRDEAVLALSQVNLVEQLPTLMERVSAVLLEVGSKPPAVRYVVDLVAEDGSVSKLVVSVDLGVQAAVSAASTRAVPLNLVRDAQVTGADALRNDAGLRLLWGRL